MTIFEGRARAGGRRLAYEAAIHATLRAGHQVIAFEPGARGAARLELDGFGGIRRVPLTPPAGPGSGGERRLERQQRPDT